MVFIVGIPLDPVIVVTSVETVEVTVPVHGVTTVVDTSTSGVST